MNLFNRISETLVKFGAIGEFFDIHRVEEMLSSFRRYCARFVDG